MKLLSWLWTVVALKGHRNWQQRELILQFRISDVFLGDPINQLLRKWFCAISNGFISAIYLVVQVISWSKNNNLQGVRRHIAKNTMQQASMGARIIFCISDKPCRKEAAGDSFYISSKPLSCDVS
jgi:hypothetical protein